MTCAFRCFALDVDGFGWSYCELPEGHAPVRGSGTGHQPTRFERDDTARPSWWAER